MRFSVSRSATCGIALNSGEPAGWLQAGRRSDVGRVVFGFALKGMIALQVAG